MRQYKVKVETINNEKYECLVDSKYKIEQATEQISTSRPDAMVMIGEELSLRSGDIKAIIITGEAEVE